MKSRKVHRCRTFLTGAVLLSLFVTAGCGPGAGPPEGSSLPDISWLEGTWVSAEGNFYEVWNDDGTGGLQGAGITVTERDTLFSEEMTIRTDGGKMVYLARVPGQNNGLPVAFPLESHDREMLRFSNPGHDFPREISYTLLSDTTLEIVVEGADPSRRIRMVMVKGRRQETGERRQEVGDRY